MYKNKTLCITCSSKIIIIWLKNNYLFWIYFRKINMYTCFTNTVLCLLFLIFLRVYDHTCADSLYSSRLVVPFLYMVLSKWGSWGTSLFEPREVTITVTTSIAISITNRNTITFLITFLFTIMNFIRNSITFTIKNRQRYLIIKCGRIGTQIS